ncbi:BBE domain-containing protein [Micromonospora musae]|uniref:BBE domain-containing protein n=1 Tax=Micromonospora musae TaxID=1894970 RepID=UPI0033CB2E98
MNLPGAGDATSEGAAAAYSPEAYQRPRAVKRSYDPTNVFRVNHTTSRPPDRRSGAHTGRQRAQRRGVGVRSLRPPRHPSRSRWPAGSPGGSRRGGLVASLAEGSFGGSAAIAGNPDCDH